VRNPPINGGAPRFLGIHWAENGELVMPVTTFVSVKRYAANLAERRADETTLDLMQNGHAMEDTNWVELVEISQSSRELVVALEKDISKIFKKIIKRSANIPYVFEIKFPPHSMRYIQLLTIQGETIIEEKRLKQCSVDFRFLRSSISPREE
jgi:hypothetical protein